MAVNRGGCPGLVRGKPLPEESHRKCPPRVYLSHSSVRFLSQAFNGRDRPTDQRLVYGKSTRMLGLFSPFHSLESGKNNFSLHKICVEFPYPTPCWVEHFVLNFSFYPPCRVAYCTDCVQFCIEFCWRHTGWMSIEHCWNYTKSFFSSFHLDLVFSHMEDSTDIELYEEIVGNPA